MEENNQGGNASDAGADPLTQFKAEFSRKTDGLKSEIAELKSATSVLVEALSRTAQKPAAAAKSEESLTDLMYSDPERYAQIIEERAVGRVAKQQEAQMRTQQVIGELHNEFPELNDTQSPLTKKAVEIYSSLSDEEKRSTTSYKLAVKEAAAELGVKPRSKRTDEENFSSGSYSSGGTRRPKADKLDPGVIAWAERLGVDHTDPDVRSRLIERSKRKWSSYQKPISTKKKGAK
jgi:hypothetical protein